MHGIIKWGLIILAVYVAWRWWQSQQVTAQPAWTPGLTGSVYGGGIVSPYVPPVSTYQPYSAQSPASSIMASGNPGYVAPLQPVSIWRRIGANGPVVTNPVNLLGLVGVRRVGPTPNFGGTAN